jgi:hypothetical protein
MMITRKFRSEMIAIFLIGLIIITFSFSETGLRAGDGNMPTNRENTTADTFDETQYVRARIELQVDSHQFWQFPDGRTELEEMLALRAIKGYRNKGWIFSGNTLTGQWKALVDYSSGFDEEYQGAVMLTLNEDHDNIIAFGGYDQFENFSSSGRNKMEIVKASGINIPLVSRGEDYDRFYMRWENLCSHLTNLSWREEWFDGLKKSLVSYSCSSHENDDPWNASYIEIKLYKGIVDPNRIVVWNISGDNAELLRAGQEDAPVKLSAGEELSVNDRILTGMDTKVIIYFFANDSKVTLEELSDITITEHFVDPVGVRTRLWLKAGIIASEINSGPGVRTDFLCRMSTAICGVRGTRFTIKFDPVTQETDVYDVDGNVFVIREQNTEENPKALFQNGDNDLLQKAKLDSVMLNPWEKVTVSESSMGPVTPINLTDIIINPGYIVLNPLQNYQFSARGISDENESMDIGVEWSAESGLIDNSGLYIASHNTGEYRITIEEPVHNLRAYSTVYIKPDSLTNDIRILMPHVSALPDAGQEFWVEIKVGDALNPINDLFGLNFNLNFTQTEYFDVKTPHSVHVLPGDFMGDDLIFSQTVDETSGKISTGISRKAGQASLSGYGTVLRIKFVSKQNTPQGTVTSLSITDIDAKDEQGAPIQLSALGKTVTITSTTATPTFDPIPGTYSSPQNVSINCQTPGAVIRYTTNGIEPTEADQIYDSPIGISQITTIKAKSFKNGFNPSPVVTGTYVILTTGVNEDNLSLPGEFVLFQNFPNPFNPETELTYSIPGDNSTVDVVLEIFNLSGIKIRSLVNSRQSAGFYRVNWNGRNHQGFFVPSGLYFYRLIAGEFVQTRRMLLIK